MNYISYSVKMNVSRYPVRHISVGGQFCENEQFPFDRLCLEIKETNKCPFCGKETVMYRCDCEKFTAQFTKMQDFVHDEKHETVIHVYPYENLCGQTNNINVDVEQLAAHEIEDLGPDFWDEARKVIDNEKNHSYFVTQLSYKEERLDFIYKDLHSKSVYRCSMKGYGYKKHKFYIGTSHRKPILMVIKRLAIIILRIFGKIWLNLKIGKIFVRNLNQFENLQKALILSAFFSNLI